MEPLLIQYWGNSPLWREKVTPWRKKYYFFHHGWRDCVTIWRKKSTHGVSDIWRNHPTCQRGDWLLLADDKIIMYTNNEYQQLAGV